MASSPPLTDGTFKIRFEDDDGNVITTAASALAQVWTPRGVKVGIDQPLTYHSADQYWHMDILADWSDDGTGKPIQGEFLVRAEIISGGIRFTDNARYNVSFTDKS